MKHYSRIEIDLERSVLFHRESSHHRMFEEILTGDCFDLLKKPAFIDTIVVGFDVVYVHDWNLVVDKKFQLIIEELKASLKLGFLKVQNLYIPFLNLEALNDSFVDWIKSSDFPFIKFECGLKARNEAFIVDLMKTPNLKFERLNLFQIPSRRYEEDCTQMVQRVIQNANPCFLNEVSVSLPHNDETVQLMKQFTKKLKLQKLLLVMVIPKMQTASKSHLRKIPVDLVRMLTLF